MFDWNVPRWIPWVGALLCFVGIFLLAANLAEIGRGGGEGYAGAIVVAFTHVIPAAALALVASLLIAPELGRALAERIAGLAGASTKGMVVEREHSRAQALIRDGRHREAADLLRTALEEDPADWVARRELADLCAGPLDDAEHAFELLEAAVDLEAFRRDDGHRAMVWTRLAELAEATLQDPQRAVAILDRAVEDLPADHPRTAALRNRREVVRRRLGQGGGDAAASPSGTGARE